MSLEDWLMRQEGLDPAKVKAILDDTSHILAVLKTEMPRIERLISNVQSEIGAYEAKQKELGQ